jgi:hypothetical protein
MKNAVNEFSFLLKGPDKFPLVSPIYDKLPFSEVSIHGLYATTLRCNAHSMVSLNQRPLLGYAQLKIFPDLKVRGGFLRRLLGGAGSPRSGS